MPILLSVDALAVGHQVQHVYLSPSGNIGFNNLDRLPNMRFFWHHTDADTRSVFLAVKSSRHCSCPPWLLTALEH